MVDEIEDLLISEASFLEPRDGYKKGDKRFKLIFAEL